MSTPAAGLTRVGRLDFDERSASFFRFARELGKKCRPRGICNAFGKTMVVFHPSDSEVFHTDDPKAISTQMTPKRSRKPDVIQLPLLGLDGDHTDADAALG